MNAARNRHRNRDRNEVPCPKLLPTPPRAATTCSTPTAHCSTCTRQPNGTRIPAIGPKWQQLSQTWRTKHIEYTWVHSLSGQPATFWDLAQRSLDYAIVSVGACRLRRGPRQADRGLPHDGRLPRGCRGAGGSESARCEAGDPVERRPRHAGRCGACGQARRPARRRPVGDIGRHLQARARRLPARHPTGSVASQATSPSSPPTAGTSPAPRRSASAPCGSTAQPRRVTISQPAPDRVVRDLRGLLG